MQTNAPRSRRAWFHGTLAPFGPASSLRESLRRQAGEADHHVDPLQHIVGHPRLAAVWGHRVGKRVRRCPQGFHKSVGTRSDRIKCTIRLTILLTLGR